VLNTKYVWLNHVQACSADFILCKHVKNCQHKIIYVFFFFRFRANRIMYWFYNDAGFFLSMNIFSCSDDFYTRYFSAVKVVSIWLALYLTRFSIFLNSFLKRTEKLLKINKKKKKNTRFESFANNRRVGEKVIDLLLFLFLFFIIGGKRLCTRNVQPISKTQYTYFGQSRAFYQVVQFSQRRVTRQRLQVLEQILFFVFEQSIYYITIQNTTRYYSRRFSNNTIPPCPAGWYSQLISARRDCSILNNDLCVNSRK